MRRAAFLAALLTAAPLAARPAHKQALADHFGPSLARTLADCRTCHLPEKPGEAAPAEGEDKPHNPFGARLAAVKADLRKAGKPLDIPARLEAIADEDSDGDGTTNVAELLTGHAPGDPADKPTAAELAGVAAKRADHRKYLAAYPWRPLDPVKRPAVPKADTGTHPVDAFLAAARAERGVAARPEADKATLLRRVSLDLVGLPPTPDELRAFLADTSADAYEKVVDRLLADPRYGERWGRHWMDVWRYSDWAGWEGGGQIRDSQPHIWRWRDWIVESLNADKPYDRMAVEMLAADEVAPEDADALRATGYLVRNYKMLSREKWLQDTVDHTFLAFQATTLGCARCHDHMYDPITQREYYAVRAVFEPHHVRIDRVPGRPDIKVDGLPRAYDSTPDALTYLLVRGDDRTPDKSAPVPPGVPAALGGAFEPKPVPLPRLAYLPDKRDFVVRETVELSEKAIQTAKVAAELACRQDAARLAAFVAGSDGVFDAAGRLRGPVDDGKVAIARAEVSLSEAKHRALVATVAAEALEEAGKKDSPEWTQAAKEAVLAQASEKWSQNSRTRLAAEVDLRAATQANFAAARNKYEEVMKRVGPMRMEELLPHGTAYQKRPVTAYPATSTGRRTAFARWLTDKANPLTARVAVNHIWLRHFGQAIVPSVFDFGRNGRRPTHPALLDWLAAEFQESGWKMKPLHRLMMTSRAYRSASTPESAALKADPDNLLLWRFAPRRLEAEAVRDGLLYVSGKLDLTRGGPDIDHREGLTVPRRSLYFRHAAEKQMEFLKLFDAAGVTECYQRKESVVPQQALALANSGLVLSAARAIAADLAPKATDDRAFVSAAFERVLSRPPTAAEADECLAFLKETPAAPGADPAKRAREGLVQVLLNHHEFVTVR